VVKYNCRNNKIIDLFWLSAANTKEKNVLRGIFSFSNIKIQRHLFSRLLVLVSCPIFVLGLLLIIGSSHKMEERYQELVEQENSRVKAVLFDLTTNIYNHSEDFVTNKELNELLYKDYNNTKELHQYLDSYSEIVDLLARDASISGITLYTNNASIRDYKNFTYCDSEICASDWYVLLSTTRNCLWRTEPSPSNSAHPYQLCLYRVLPLPLAKDFAIIKFVVSSNYLKIRLKNQYMPSMAATNCDYAFYNNGSILDSDKMLYNSQNMDAYFKKSGIEAINGMKCITAISTLVPYRSDDCIYIFTYSQKAYNYIIHQACSYLAVVLMSLLIPCFFLYIYTGYFSARIATLRTAMQRASHGDYNIIDSYHGDDELSETFQGLITLINSIKTQEEGIYQSQIREQALINQQQELENQQQQIEYRILASQINPHFLYNTLESIRMKAINEGNLEIAKAVKLLGRYLHYSLESIGKTSTSLSRELEYVEMYLLIQKMRFKNRVNYQIDIDSTMNPKEYEILPFLLQPIVENSVLHGLEGQSRHGMIFLKIIQETENLIITIRDNGEGINPDKLKEIKEKLDCEEVCYGKSIGLSNINHRIKIHYGQSYGLNVESQPGHGTMVTISLPSVFL